jgi:CCR4-NOT transcription complex subunit 1
MLFQRLIGELLSFLKPHLARAKLSEPIRQLYNGTLRVLLVLLHDFPEFLSDYHFSLCDAIPPTCVQMRNLVLSAFPRNMRLPDPFTPNLKVDVLPEISQPPRMLSNHMPLLQRAEGGALLNDVNTYLAARQPPSFITTLAARIRHLALLDAGAAPGTDAFGAAAASLISALTLHIGQQAIAQLQSAAASPLAHSAPMDVFARLMNEFDAECRYLLVNAIANQLRYPNNHTHYFSCALLYLFAEAQREVVQEQITRVLLERLIVNRPHPWGLLITFIELIKNPRYRFWAHGFTRCAPEVERLFESVARSCMVNEK